MSHSEALTMLQMFNDNRCGKRFVNKGYWFVRPTPEYTGNLNNGFVAFHVLLCCTASGIAEVPLGYDVHHRCEVKTHNHPDNLQLLTHSAHAKLHARGRNDSTERDNARTHICPNCKHDAIIHADSAN